MRWGVVLIMYFYGRRVMGDNSKNYEEFTINFKLEEDVPIDQYELTMYNYEFVGNNTKCQVVEIDNVRALQFKIPATLPLELFLKKQLYKGEFLSILSNIMNQLMYFDENKMPLNKLLLNIQYMYIELSTLDVQLIYMPVNKKFADCNITEFIQKFIGAIRFANMDCVELVDKILKYLDSKLMFDLQDFYNYVLFVLLVAEYFFLLLVHLNRKYFYYLIYSKYYLKYFLYLLNLNI